MLGGKFVAKLFRQLQLALVCPDLQRNLFLLGADRGRKRKRHGEHEQQRNDLLHNSLLLHNYLTNGFLPLPLSLYRLHKNWSTKI